MRTLTLQQAIRNAIEAEDSAAEFYRRMAHRTDDPVTQKFFEDMGKVERIHADEIEGLGRSLVEESLPETADSDVALIESAPEWMRAAESLPGCRGTVLPGPFANGRRARRLDRCRNRQKNQPRRVSSIPDRPTAPARITPR